MSRYALLPRNSRLSAAAFHSAHGMPRLRSGESAASISRATIRHPLIRAERHGPPRMFGALAHRWSVVPARDSSILQERHSPLYPFQWEQRGKGVPTARYGSGVKGITEASASRTLVLFQLKTRGASPETAPAAGYIHPFTSSKKTSAPFRERYDSSRERLPLRSPPALPAALFSGATW
jgi:hypothetical protein